MSRNARVLAIVLAIAGASRSARADDTTAAVAFQHAEELGKQGKWSEACPLYDASYRADPQLGVLLHLADCHERIGRLASAWLEFTDATELARTKGDSREALARSRADALAPKLAKLHLTPPARLYPGLVVKRDGSDITILVGTDMPIDPGDHEIIASAPGFIEWKKKITIAGQGATPLEIPALEKIPDKPVEVAKPVVHEGMLKITTQADAEIRLDSDPVGTGHYEGKVKSGGHTLRVTAPGMRPYQNEITVLDDQTRAIDVPLEKEQALVVVAPAPPVDTGPSFELGASMSTGAKLRADNPLVVALRAELAFRIGRRVNFGLFAEYGTIQTSNACGTDMPGPTPATPFDFGPRNQFTSCSYVMPGLQLYVHILPKGTFDPYVGIAPGFRFGFYKWTTYPLAMSQSEIFPGLVNNVRVGVDYHPKGDDRTWEVGAFVDASITIIGQEGTDEVSKDPASYLTLSGGLRSSLAF
jgi:hypothetical protein